MKSVRKLEKRSFRRLYEDMNTVYSSYGRDTWPILPATYFVFAADSMNLDSMRESLDAKHEAENMPLWQRIDTVCVLNKGVVTNKKSDGSTWATPLPDTKLSAVPTEHALLLFYILLSLELNQANMPTLVFESMSKTCDSKTIIL
ncbi:MAG TPA: hypothetical protein VGQ03_07450, partial [Nitrososphaera sp.]|nr:hypothetical protein [Nitrososphaera sp.]